MALLRDADMMQAVAQTVDSLAFAHTHEADLNFRAYGVGQVTHVRALQDEQQRRIAQTYGPRAPSPAFLSSQLLATYRGEAASTQLMRAAAAAAAATSGGAGGNAASASADATTNVVTSMSEAQMVAFKKQLKQRIHEWERAVCEATGQAEVTLEQKTRLRVIYDVYKECKTKLTTTATSATASGSMTRSLSQPAVTTAVSGSAAAAAATRGSGSSSGGSGSATRAHGGAASTLASGSTSAVTVANEPVMAAASRTTTTTTQLPRPASAPSSSSSSAATTTTASAATTTTAASASGGGSNSSEADVEERILRTLPRVTLGKTPAARLSDSDVAEEKRRIKQVLHRYEEEFERAVGHRPERQNRHGLSREYRRYGELKNELARRSGGGGGAAASNNSGGSHNHGSSSSSVASNATSSPPRSP